MKVARRQLLSAARWCRRGLIPITCLALALLVATPLSMGERGDQARACIEQVVTAAEDLPRQALPEADISRCMRLLTGHSQGGGAERQSRAGYLAVYLSLARMLTSPPRDSGRARGARAW